MKVNGNNDCGKGNRVNYKQQVVEKRTSHGGKRSNRSQNLGNGDDRDGSDCNFAGEEEEVVPDDDEDNLLQRSNLDNRLRKDVKTVVDNIHREGEVEDILRDETEEKDIPVVAVPMDNPEEVNSEIGILIRRIIKTNLRIESKTKESNRIESNRSGLRTNLEEGTIPVGLCRSSFLFPFFF